METSEEKQDNEAEIEVDDLDKSKYVEFYSQSYASFYNTTMEK